MISHVYINGQLPLIERRDCQQLFQRDAAEIPRRGEAPCLLGRAANPLVALQGRARARYVRGRKIGRLNADRVGADQGARRIGGRRVVLRQERLDVLRVDHQDGGTLDVRLPRDVQLDQDAARYPVEQWQTKHGG